MDVWEKLGRKLVLVEVRTSESVQKTQGEVEAEVVRVIHTVNCLANQSSEIAPGCVTVVGKLYHAFGDTLKEIDVCKAAGMLAQREAVSSSSDDGSLKCPVLQLLPPDRSVEHVVQYNVMNGQLYLFVKYESSFLSNCLWVPAAKCLQSTVCLSFLRRITDPDEKIQSLLAGKCLVLGLVPQGT
jgi:hypothetical protein